MKIIEFLFLVEFFILAITLYSITNLTVTGYLFMLYGGERVCSLNCGTLAGTFIIYGTLWAFGGFAIGLIVNDMARIRRRILRKEPREE